jgi:predicted RNase H-like nuclease (RuvC/YqgF family)
MGMAHYFFDDGGRNSGMSVTASDYQSLKLKIKELEEMVSELKRDNEEKAKIIAEQAKTIEELKAKLAKYENPHTPSSAQRYKKVTI